MNRTNQGRSCCQKITYPCSSYWDINADSTSHIKQTFNLTGDEGVQKNRRKFSQFELMFLSMCLFLICYCTCITGEFGEERARSHAAVLESLIQQRTCLILALRAQRIATQCLEFRTDAVVQLTLRNQQLLHPAYMI